jgi:branched-subunit amino acid ABC-type transport system permease component
MRRTPWSEYSPAYWVCVIGAIALLIVDIFSDLAWTNVATIVLIAIAVLIRPGGLRGPRGRTDPGA